MPLDDTIPYGYCQCGCGQKTPLAPQGSTERGWTAGEPIRYIHGHNAQGRTKADLVAGTKECAKCKVVKPLDDFGRNSSKADGRSVWCKPCSRAYYKDYYEKNKTTLTERYREWDRAHPEVRAQIHRNRRAAIKRSRGTLTTKQWSTILRLADGKCLGCGEECDDLTLDHIMPLSKGGEHIASNVQPLCMDCNRKKAARFRDYRDPKVYAEFMVDSKPSCNVELISSSKFPRKNHHR